MCWFHGCFLSWTGYLGGVWSLWELHPKPMANLMGKWWADLGADGCYPILLVSRGWSQWQWKMMEHGDQTCGGDGDLLEESMNFSPKKWGAYHEWWPFWGGKPYRFVNQGTGDPNSRQPPMEDAILPPPTTSLISRWANPEPYTNWDEHHTVC